MNGYYMQGHYYGCSNHVSRGKLGSLTSFVTCDFNLILAVHPVTPTGESVMGLSFGFISRPEISSL